MNRRVVPLLGAGLVATSAIALILASPTAPTDHPSVEQPTAPALHGAFSAIDPEGSFRAPNAAQTKKLSQELGRALSRHAPSNAAVAERFRPDGAISKVLPLEHLSFSVARLGPDGALHRDCAHGPDEAAHFLVGDAPVVKTPATPEEM